MTISNKEKRARAFQMFEKHPRMSVAAIADKYGFAKSSLYKWKNQWLEERGEIVIERPVIEQNIQFSTATFLLGVALGVALTVILTTFGA